MTNLISNSSSYVEVGRYPTNSSQETLNSMAKTLYDSKLIDLNIKKRIPYYNDIVPKLYGLPKIHMPTQSIRLIVAAIVAPISVLASILSDILT